MAGERILFHVDMDAFFAAVEMRDHPELLGRPVLVAGAGARGVVATASYEARAFGCHSAQPTAYALRLCPHAVIVPPRHDHYSAVSDVVFEVFSTFSPVIEPLSIDEAFIDMTGTERLHGPPEQAAAALRAAVREATGGLTCSVGISAVKFIAKIASGENKPDGVTVVAPGDELSFLEPMAIGKLWGVGPKTQARLAEHGIRTVGDLRRRSRDTLVAWFGAHGEKLFDLSWARDPRAVEPGRLRKQIGHEDTYAEDVRGRDALCRKLLSQATRIADRLTSKHMHARCVHLKIRDHTFKTESRQTMLAHPTCDARVLYQTACRLLDTIDGVDRRAFRLTGVSVSELSRGEVTSARQLDLLFDERSAETKRVAESAAEGERLQGVVTEIRQRFGHNALFPADAGDSARPGTTGAVTRTVDPDRDR